jgi:glutamyl-tRNA synthetase
MIRLKDLFNVSLIHEGGTCRARYAGDDLQEARNAKAPIIQWLPAGYGIPCLIKKADGDLSGVCEPGVSAFKDRVVQFERVGFTRIDAVGDGITAYFSHR